jgi:hypothetical protein
MNPKIAWSVLILLAGFALYEQFIAIPPYKDEPSLQVESNFKSCLMMIVAQRKSLGPSYGPKKCDEVNSMFRVLFSESSIFYDRKQVSLIQGRDVTDGKWYQAHITDERRIRVVRVGP